MSALEMYLKAAAEAKGTWHKQQIINVRIYMAGSHKEDIIAAIKTIKDQALLRILWEAGLDDELQQAVIYQSKKLAKEAGEEVK
jgi:hypothetical protein